MFQSDSASLAIRSLEADCLLEDALEDAQLLVAFGVRGARSLKQELVVRIENAIAPIKNARAANRAPTSAELANFWQAYDQLAVDQAPVSAHSIRSTDAVLRRPWPVQLLSSMTFFAAAVAVFFYVAVQLQSYWVAGMELLEQAAALTKQRTVLSPKLRQTQDDVARLEMQLGGMPAGAMRTAAASPRGAKTVPVVDDRVPDSAYQMLMLQLKQAQRSVDHQSQELDEISLALKQWDDVLMDWYRPSQYWCGQLLICDKGWVEQYKSRRMELENRLSELRQVKAATVAVQGIGSDRSSTDLRASAYWDWAQRTNDVRRIEQQIRELSDQTSKDLVHRAKMMLAAIGNYFVPMLMGLLGALTYMLRSLVAQLKDHTYTPGFASLALVRMCLGMVAGVLGGLVVPITNGQGQAFPPLALPFIFGYGIEILFAALDRLVKTFTTPAEKGAA
jgi:hypothetical protein